jgi:hypothetical protein
MGIYTIVHESGTITGIDFDFRSPGRTAARCSAWRVNQLVWTCSPAHLPTIQTSNRTPVKPVYPREAVASDDLQLLVKRDLNVQSSHWELPLTKTLVWACTRSHSRASLHVLAGCSARDAMPATRPRRSWQAALQAPFGNDADASE